MALPLPATYNLPDSYLGDTIALDQFTIADPDIDFTGCEIQCAFKRLDTLSQVSGFVVKQFLSRDFSLIIDSSVDGYVAFTIPPFRWLSPPGLYKYDIEIYSAVDDIHQTYFAGTLTVTEDTTKWQ